MTAYNIINIDYFHDVFFNNLFLYFVPYFDFLQTISSTFVTVMVVCLIVAFFARESLNFIKNF